MLQRFLSLFQNPTPTDGAEERRRNALAACVLLLEAAHADDSFTNHERALILEVIRARFDLDGQEAEALMHEAMQERAASADLWQFTRRVNEAFDVPTKIAIVEEVWRLIYSDGTLTSHEDFLAHKLRALLNLNHRQLIDAKLRVRKEKKEA